MRFKRIILFLGLLALNLVPFALSHAQVDIIGLQYGAQTGLSGSDPRIAIAQVIRVSLGLLGIVMTCILLYAGFKWMTAGGNEDEVNSAKKTIYSAVVGLLIIMSAYAITAFVLRSLSRATLGQDLIE